MAGLATRRLIDAAAKLDPADRALLNLWVNRGLDDERLTGLTGMSQEALQVRRANIVARLAADLGLPESNVRDALTQISPDDGGKAPPPANGAAGLPDAPNGAAPDLEGDAVTAAETPPAPEAAPTPEPEAAPTPEPEGAPTAADAPPQRRRWLWLGLAALGVAVIAAVVIGIAAAGGTTSPTPRRAASTPTTPTTPTTTQTPTVTAPALPTSGAPVPVPLAGLPGGLAHASGSVKLSGPVKHLKLNLTVRGLPAAHAGHYEVWLYNSVLDSRPLGRLRDGHHRLTASLPHRARHYRWIDISFQPVGVVYHSGESELRASNPAHTTTARLRKRSSRTRHRLRQAAGASLKHPARKHTTARPAHRGRRHRARRVAHGSRKARTSK